MLYTVTFQLAKQVEELIGEKKRRSSDACRKVKKPSEAFENTHIPIIRICAVIFKFIQERALPLRESSESELQSEEDSLSRTMNVVDGRMRGTVQRTTYWSIGARVIYKS